MVSPAYAALWRNHTHSPKAKCLSTVICLWPGHVQRMDRKCTTPNFERYVELSITINNPCIPVERWDVDQLGTLGARIDCIHYISVAQRKVGVRKLSRGIATHLGIWGMENPVSKTICN